MINTTNLINTYVRKIGDSYKNVIKFLETKVLLVNSILISMQSTLYQKKFQKKKHCIEKPLCFSTITRFAV